VFLTGIQSFNAVFIMTTHLALLDLS
jgi:hypothetical protein